MDEQKEVATNKGETKTPARKKGEGLVTVVLKTEVHYDGCAKKLNRIIKKFKGVNDVNVDIGAKKLTIVGKVDPAKLRQRVEDKTHQKVHLLSSLPITKENKPAFDNNKPADKKLEDDDKKPKESTVVLKINPHCEGYIKKIKSSISKIKVMLVSIDASKDVVTIKGTMEAKDLAPSLQAKFRRSVEVVPPKKEEPAKEGGGRDKKPKENKESTAAGEKKPNTENNKDESMKKELVVREPAPPIKFEVNKMEYHGYANNYMPPPPPIYGYYGGVYQNVDPYQLAGYGAPTVKYNGRVAAAHAPQVFSDENPNACFIML